MEEGLCGYGLEGFGGEFRGGGFGWGVLKGRDQVDEEEVGCFVDLIAMHNAELGC
jgi:hypothetical protein